MTGRQRAVGLIVIAALALLTVGLGVTAAPMAIEAAPFAIAAAQPAGTEIVTTKERLELAQGLPLWGSLFLASFLALATAVFVVALRWPRERTSH